MSAPCIDPSCVCRMSDHGCSKGWTADTETQTTPCPHCRPALARIVGSIPPPGQRSVIDLARFRTERKAA